MLLATRPTGLSPTLVVVALSLISAESAAAKCSTGPRMPGYESGEPVILIDGSVLPLVGSIAADRFEQEFGIDPSNIHSMTLTCWNPATGEIGGGVGQAIFLILTERLVESTRAPLENLLRAQEAHFSELSRYAQSLDDLVRFGVPQDAMLKFSATSAGWSAATPQDDVARCFVFSGDAPQEVAEMKEHEIVCEPEGGKASRALREMWDELTRA